MTEKKRIIKPWEELTIIDDYMFKLVMRHPHICTRLIEKILDIKIKHINYLEDEKSLKFRYAGKGIRLDVYVEADDTIYNIEMQVRDYGDKELAYRTRYYQSLIDVEALAAGANYSDLKKSFVIFLCPFKLFQNDRHMYTFRNVCIQDKDMELDDGTTKIFLSSEGTMDDVSPDIKAFLDYMKGLPVQDEFANEVDNFIKEIKGKEEERASYMTYEMKILEAHNDGKEEGIKEGEKIADRRTAVRMLQKGKSTEEIVEFVDLSKEEIEELSRQS
ncbi:hypothetical protein D081_0666 [Anaerovibrio sp. JC8]|uniref:Rpn family recombination-promoting nuclease/putative transposase n=1 Tax=Anaerovibrio sp. JC8 TaxID=1240085 RepID=UPI000A0A43B1|nr:Rpn family recombination-promoting nuclease/putative transposase [Anaerovibrio sp. JC8]ORU00684.1 hypothetical protein D081_0666 [Anaerovibrio sp. JC8]